MNKRSREILLGLMDLEKTFRISELAEKFQVSERTIRNDINDVNDFLEQHELSLVKLGSNGTLLVEDDIELAAGLFNQNDFYTYRLSKGERKPLIAAILIEASDYTTLSNMAEHLYVSRATVINDLESVKQMLLKEHLTVESHSNKGLVLHGKESDKRACLLKLLNQDGSFQAAGSVVQSFIRGLNISHRLKKEDKQNLQKIINEQEHAHGRFLTDASFNYLLSYLTILIQRVKKGHQITESLEVKKSKYEMAEDILRYVCQYWELPESQGEKELLSDILDSLSYIKKDSRNQRIIGLQLVTRKFIEQISNELHVDLNRDFVFYENLVNHLESIFTKEFNITQRDDFLRQIVEQNQETLYAVKNNIEMLERFVGRKIQAIEADYIVIHISAALERRKKKEIEFRVVIVCNGGVGTSQLLLAKMRNRFDFHIVDVVSAHDLRKSHYEDIDMIVSTIPLKDYEGEYVLVTPMFYDEDYLRVNKKIELLQKKNRGSKKKLPEKDRNPEELSAILRPMIRDLELFREVSMKIYEYFGESFDEEWEPFLWELLREKNIQLNIECRDWKDAIRKSAEPLLFKGYIEERYVDAMIENVLENGSYIVISKGFALPHEGFELGSKKVGMNMIRLKEPVVIEDEDGDREEVRFFCCLSTVDHKKHIKAFFHLVNMLTNQRFKEELWNAESPRETAAIIKTYEQRIKE